MGGTWRGAHCESACCGSLVLSAEGMLDRPASLTSRDRRETPSPRAWATAGLIASSLDQWFAARWTVLIADARRLARG